MEDLAWTGLAMFTYIVLTLTNLICGHLANGLIDLLPPSPPTLVQCKSGCISHKISLSFNQFPTLLFAEACELLIISALNRTLCNCYVRPSQATALQSQNFGFINFNILFAASSQLGRYIQQHWLGSILLRLIIGYFGHDS